MKVVLGFHANGDLSYYASLANTKAENPASTEEECGAAVLEKMRQEYPDDKETLSVKGWTF